MKQFKFKSGDKVKVIDIKDHIEGGISIGDILYIVEDGSDVPFVAKD